jgi:hypothetical protein
MNDPNGTLTPFEQAHQNVQIFAAGFASAIELDKLILEAMGTEAFLRGLEETGEALEPSQVTSVNSVFQAARTAVELECLVQLVSGVSA